MSFNINFKVFKGISLYTISSLSLNFCSLFTGLITYKFIEPYYIGIWQTLLLIETYLMFMRMGIINGMNRELPFELGKGNKSIAISHAETTLAFTLLLIVTIIVISTGILLFGFVSPKWVFPCLVMMVIVSIKFFNSFLLGTYRANADFSKLTNIQFIQAVLKLAAILLVVKWKFNGLLIKELVLISSLTFLTYHYRPMKSLKVRFNRDSFRKLFKVGFPIFVGGYLIGLLNTVPKLIILKFGTISMLGIYAPLLTVLTAISVIPDSISAYLYPKMTFSLGQSNDKLKIWKKALFTHLGIFILGIPVALGCWYFVPMFFERFLPNYVESNPLIKTGVFIAIFMGYKFGYTTLITLKEWKLIVLYLISFAILQIVPPIILIKHYTVLDSVVYGQLIGSSLMIFVSLLTNYKAAFK